jgi:hypothetical protein
MSESPEPGSHATFTHSPGRGLDASRAAAALLLGGRPAVPVAPEAPAGGAARSAADRCAECSSIDTPGACAERLHRVRDEFGPGRVIGWFGFGGLIPHDPVMRGMELFSSGVLPHA